MGDKTFIRGGGRMGLGTFSLGRDRVWWIGFVQKNVEFPSKMAF